MASEAVPAAAAMAAGSGRRPARGQHRKAPSDTFAWAAAQVLTQLPPTANGLSAVPDTFPRGGATLSAPLLPGLAKPPGELVAAHAGSLPGLPNQLVDILQGVTEDELGEQELLPDATEDMDQLDDGLGASGSQQSSEDGEELEGRGRSARRTSSGGRDSSGAPGGGTRRRAASSAGGRGRHTRTPSDSTVSPLRKSACAAGLRGFTLAFCYIFQLESVLVTAALGAPFDTGCKSNARNLGVA